MKKYTPWKFNSSPLKISHPKKKVAFQQSDVSAVPFPQFGSDFSGKNTPAQKKWSVNFQFGFWCAFQFGSLKPPGFFGKFFQRCKLPKTHRIG